MTIKTRNYIILFGLAVIVLLFAGYLTSLILFSRRLSRAVEVFSGRSLTGMFVSLFLELLFCLSTVTVLYFSFRKTTSPEVFFFIIFIISMAFDSLKSGQAFFMVYNFSPYYGVLLTRTVYFGRFLGTLSIFAGAIFLHGAEYQRMEIFLGIALLLSFSLSAAVPVDITATDANLLYKVGNSRELGIISVLFLALGVGNLLVFAVQNASWDHGLMALGLGLAVAGRELLFFAGGTVAAITAFALLVGGVILFGERTHNVRLWS